MKKFAFALAIVAAVGGLSLTLWHRSPSSASDQHGAKAEAAHDHSEEGLKITQYGDKTQVFIEFQRLVAGQETSFAAHITRLVDFKAIDQGKLTLSLVDASGKPLDTATADAPSVPGIFRPVIKPSQPGERRLVLHYESANLSAMHDLGPLIVYPSKDSAQQAAHTQAGEDGGGVAFTKEQQWKMEFATAVVAKRSVRSSVAATGTLRAEPDNEAQLVAPSAGIVTAAGALPRIGQTVTKGQLLAYLAPRLGGEVDIATLETSARKAKIALESVRSERERLEKLYTLEAVPEKRVLLVRSEEQAALAEMDAAQRRLGQYAGQGGGIPLRAPISGVVADVRVGAGAFVNDGQMLFHIADRKSIWLEARVAEVDVGRLGSPQGASFNVAGIDDNFVIQAGDNARLVAVGGVIDPSTRTVPVIFAIRTPDPRLSIGMNVRVSVYAAAAREALTIPVGALLDENGQAVVYVEKGGESYERRTIELGNRDGDFIEVKQGLAGGERVVSRGAYQVRLAALSPAAVGHGHAH